MSKLRAEHHIEVDLDLGELDLTAAESKASYEEIKTYVLEKFGLKVSSLFISQVKRKFGMEVGDSFNQPKCENAKVPTCPLEKEKAIVAAFKHFNMIRDILPSFKKNVEFQIQKCYIIEKEQPPTKWLASTR